MSARRFGLGLLSISLLVMTLPGCDSSEKAAPPVSASQLQTNFENAVTRGNDEAAVVIARTLNQRYPSSPEASAVNTKLPQVQARAQVRRDELKAAADKSAKEVREKSAAQFKTLLTRMARSQDDVEHITWFEPKANRARAGATTYATLYVGLSDAGSVWLRTRMQYGGSDWIFFERLKFSIDGTTLPAKPFGYFNVKRDNSSGDVWEWIDLAVEDDALPLMEKLAEGKTVGIRFEGKYYQDLKLSGAMKQSMRDALDLYQLMKRGLRPS